MTDYGQGKGRAAEQEFRGLRDVKHLRADDESDLRTAHGIITGVGIGVLLWLLFAVVLKMLRPWSEPVWQFLFGWL